MGHEDILAVQGVTEVLRAAGREAQGELHGLTDGALEGTAGDVKARGSVVERNERFELDSGRRDGAGDG